MCVCVHITYVRVCVCVSVGGGGGGGDLGLVGPRLVLHYVQAHLTVSNVMSVQ